MTSIQKDWTNNIFAWEELIFFFCTFILLLFNSVGRRQRELESVAQVKLYWTNTLCNTTLLLILFPQVVTNVYLEVYSVRVRSCLVIGQPQRPGEQQHQQAVPSLSVALWGQTDEVAQSFITHPERDDTTQTHIHDYDKHKAVGISVAARNWLSIRIIFIIEAAISWW